MSFGTFDATQYQPRQGGQVHPVGKFPFTITDTGMKGVKDEEQLPPEQRTKGMFYVTFTSPQGEHTNNYNLWNPNAQTVQIAHGQLSALCYATGIFRLNFDNAGAELRGARGMMEIGYQKGNEPTSEKPAGGYVELKKVFDANGNEPGKTTPAPSPQVGQSTSHPQANAQTMAPPWPGPNSALAAAPSVNGNSGVVGWQPQGAQSHQQASNGPAWQQGPAQATPPWANK